MTINTRGCNCDACIHEEDCEHKGMVLETKLNFEEVTRFVTFPACLNLTIDCKYYETTIPQF